MLDRHSQDEADLAPQVMDVACLCKGGAVLCQLGTSGRRDGDDADDDPFVLWQVDTVVIKVVFEHDNPGGVDPRNRAGTQIGPRIV